MSWYGFSEAGRGWAAGPRLRGGGGRPTWPPAASSALEDWHDWCLLEVPEWRGGGLDRLYVGACGRRVLGDARDIQVAVALIVGREWKGRGRQTAARAGLDHRDQVGRVRFGVLQGDFGAQCAVLVLPDDGEAPIGGAADRSRAVNVKCVVNEMTSATQRYPSSSLASEVTSHSGSSANPSGEFGLIRRVPSRRPFRRRTAVLRHGQCAGLPGVNSIAE